MFDLTKFNKVLIVNSRSSNRKLTGMVMWGAWAVASYLDHSGVVDVKYLDENNEDDFLDKFNEAIKDREVVGFSLTSMQIKYTLPLIQYTKANYPQIKVVVGGIHPILFPDQDYGELIDEVIVDELPKSYFSYKFLPEKVKEVYRNKRAQVVTGFNCSYKCTFCVNSVRNCRYEGVPIERIIQDIDYIVKEFNPPKIYFRDEDFYQDINKARAIVEHIIQKKYTFKWESTSRVTNFMPGRVDDEFLALMVKAGCQQVRFGVESGSQRMLNYLRKGQTVEQIKFAVRQCVKYGLDASCSMIIGIPTETAEDREATYKLIVDLRSYGPLVEILGPQAYRPYPGGQLFEEVKKSGMSFPDKFVDWATYYDRNPIGDVFDAKTNYLWLTPKENRFLPYVWVVAHYGVNYGVSNSLIKKIIAQWFLWHWRLRWFGGWDLKLFMWLRKKLLKTDLE